MRTSRAGVGSLIRTPSINGVVIQIGAGDWAEVMLPEGSHSLFGKQQTVMRKLGSRSRERRRSGGRGFKERQGKGTGDAGGREGENKL